MSNPMPLITPGLERLREVMLSPVTLPLWLVVLATAVLLAVWLMCHRHHQRSLALKAWLMGEAVHNGDFSFRLSTQGLHSGERALLDALNNMGHEIGTLMDQREMESWQRLTRVLTHEIMNATAPISSITQAWLASPDIKGSRYEEGLRAIQATTAGLTTFVESYRKMTQLQQPVPCEVCLAGVAGELQAMYPSIDWHVRLEDAPTVLTDPHLLRQILTNLVKNAIEAGAARIGLDWHDALLISNDGQPIPSDMRREIFVPFFTTKRTGSGIGLSFSRQIIMAQGGNLSLLPVPVSGYHTTFALSFGDRKP